MNLRTIESTRTMTIAGDSEATTYHHHRYRHHHHQPLIKSCLTMLIVVLISLITTVTPLPFELEGRAKFNCPETTSCSCSYAINDYEIHCPPVDARIVVHIQPERYVQIECMTMDEKDYALLPPIQNVGNISTVKINRCPLPTGSAIKTILERLGTHHIRTLMFQSFGADLGHTLVRDHLKGLNELERLLLSGNGLSDLPEDLFADVRNLTWLDLRSNKVHLPRDIFVPLEKLEYLELGYNYLQNLEEGVFRSQKHLKHLNLWGNRLHNLTKSAFEGVSSIMELDLSSNNIITLQPDVFAKLTNLTNLNLSANNFTHLPEGLFSENKKLSRFRLMDNRINLESLPPRLFADLPDLEDVRIRCELINVPETLFTGSINIRNISLASNAIEVLPANLLADQSNLLDLDLSRNKLTQLSDQLFDKTRSLIVLKLSYNQLVNISRHVFSEMHSLSELYLDNNNLHRIHPQAFVTTTSIQVIVLENNHLTFVDEESGLYVGDPFELGSPFQNLNELRVLNLRNNSLTNIFRDWMLNNIRLNILDLSYNKISSISYSDLQFLSRKITVDLTHNQIREIDLHDLELVAMSQEFLDTPSDIVILIEANPLVCNCVSFPLLKYLRNEMSPDVRKVLRIIPGELRCIAPDALEGQLIADVNPMDLLCSLDSESSEIKKCPSMCSCWVRPVDKALIYNCSNADLTKVPKLTRTASLGLSFIELHIENNSISKLPKADVPGYADVAALYASYNNITINVDNIPKNLTELDLSNNNMNYLNTSVIEALNSTKKLGHISLGGNPWICDCEAKSLLNFVQTNFKKISDLNNMQCSNGEKLSSITPAKLCGDDEGIIIIASVVVAFLSLVIGVLAALYYKYQQEVKVWLFAHNMCLWFVREEELDKDKKYDAFVSYSHKDEDFITEHLVPELENGTIPFKLCLHIRDWVPGEFIPNQIAKSVEDSRRTIVVLSPNFLESIWGRMEFRAAHSAALSEGRARIIIIIYGEIGDTENLDPELKAYLNMNTYVKWGDPWFWNKLRYAMPHPSNNRSMGLVKTAIKSSTDDKLELIKPVPVTPPLTTPPAEQASKNPLVAKLNGEINQNGKLPNGINGHVNGAFIINTNAKQSDV